MSDQQRNPRQASDDSPQGEAASANATDFPGGDSLQELERLQTELNETRDRLLRTQAEFDNFRKRSRREIEDERKYANVPLLHDLLPVLDNTDRAIEAAQKTSDAAALLDGFKLLKQQLETALQRHHCLPIKALGEHFDPNLHAAITAQPSSQHPAGTVLHEVQTGYQLHDRVIRPSQVVVSTAPEE